VRELAPALHDDVNALDAAYAAIYRDHPFQTPPALAGAIRALLRQPGFASILDGPRDAATKGDA